jgi:release factor glutamine methyltransferase
VIANLPYVPTDEVGRLPVAASFEPRAALDGGPDGLAAIRRLLGEAPGRLAAGGALLLEVGDAQAEAVRRTVRELPLRAEIDTLRDLAGVERVVRLRAVEGR